MHDGIETGAREGVKRLAIEPRHQAQGLEAGRNVSSGVCMHRSASSFVASVEGGE
jgi:hypothetical protein